MSTNRDVAIKVLREVYSTNDDFVTGFQQEAKTALSLYHPNIVQAYDYGQSEDTYFTVMELVEGMDLRRYLRKHGVLDVIQSVHIARDIALGLGHAHSKGIVHRGINPSNVMRGIDGQVKITASSMPLGNIIQYYTSAMTLGENFSPADDVYALGIVMYEMLTGRTPFDGDTPVEVAMQHIHDRPMPPTRFNPTIPPDLEDIILQCLEKVPDKRFHDGTQLPLALNAASI